MKNMVSGRKLDRNRKNIVFGEIPPKKWWSKKKIRSSKIFRWSKFFRSSSRKFFLTQQNIFRSKIFSTSKKKCRPIFSTIIFLCPKTSFRQLFFLTSFFAFYIGSWFARSTLWVWAHAGERAKMRSSNLCVRSGYELDDKEILGARSPNSQNR